MSLTNEILPGFDVFAERISYWYRRIQQTRASAMSPIAKLRALTSIDDEFDWILHLRGVADQQKQINLTASTDTICTDKPLAA